MPRLVIGCGNAHAFHNHANDVTIDTNANMNPTHVTSINDPQSPLLTTPAYRRHFDIVYFENVPSDAFDSDSKCKIVVTHLAILLTNNGRVRIRSGAATREHLPKLKKAFKSFGFVIEHDLIETDTGYVPDRKVKQLGIDVSDEYKEEFGTDFVVKRGAGSFSKPLESPF